MASIRHLVAALLAFDLVVGRSLSNAAVVPGQQRPLPSPFTEEHSHLSEWSRQAKADFLADMRANKADDWVIVLGNEGGGAFSTIKRTSKGLTKLADTDSMVSALAWAYHLTHLEPRQKACAVLQTVEDALDLRPENKLALHAAAMSNGHGDLLSLSLPNSLLNDIR